MKDGRTKLALWAGLIVLITFVVYIPAMRGGFIWDDEISITDNHLIKASDGLRRIWFTTEATDYWPLTATAWWLEWRLWGNRAIGYHLINVLLHAVNAVLVWMVLRRLKIPGAWLAGLVFAVHPVNVATVAWISEQKNTLSMLFYAVAILLYLRFDESGRWGWYGLSLLTFLLALLSKTAVVMLPVVLLGCVWWSRGRVGWRDWLNVAPFFVLSLVLGLVTLWFQFHHSLAGHIVRAGGFLSRLAVAGWACWFYLGKALWPVNLIVIYPPPSVESVPASAYLLGIGLAGCLSFIVWNFRSWRRPLLFGAGYFVVALFPVLGFFDQTFHRYSLVADHWQYFAIVSPIALVVAGGVAICRQWDERGRYVGASASLAALTALGVATWGRSSAYVSSETLWRDTVAKNPNAWVAHYNLGNALVQAGKVQDAMGHYQRAVEIKPDHLEAHSNLAFLLLQAGQVNNAVAHLEQAVQGNPNSAEGQHNLGFALLLAGRPEDAINHLEQAVRLKPDYAEAHYNLGNALLQAGKRRDAIAHYELAVGLRPDFADARNALDRLRAVP